MNFAKGLTMASGKPLIPVHHIRGHVAANYIDGKVKPPFLCMIMSGSHSHIVEVQDYTHYRIIGRTRDDAVGEAYDKAGRVLGFSYPAGVEMDAAARQGDPTVYHLPRPKVEGSPFDFSFSGLKTAMINLSHNAKQKGISLSVNDAAAAFQQAVCDMIAPRLMAAAAETGYQDHRVGGGVSANSGIPDTDGGGVPKSRLHPHRPAPVLLRGQRRHDCRPGVLRVFSRTHRQERFKRHAQLAH